MPSSFRFDLPSPSALPFIGHAVALTGDVGTFFTRQYDRLGPVFSVRAFGRRFTVLAGPAADVFVTRDGVAHLRSQESSSAFDAELGAARSLASNGRPGAHPDARGAPGRLLPPVYP